MSSCGAQTSNRYRLRLLFLLLTLSVGCQISKRATWYEPLVASPQAPGCARSSTLELAEHAYAYAIDLEYDDDPTCVDYYYLAATTVWADVERQLGANGVADGRTAELYRSSLTQLISAGQRFGRFDPRSGLRIQSAATGNFTVPTSYHGFPRQPNDFDYLIPIGDYSTRELNHFYCCSGLGVATVAIHFRRSHEVFRRNQQNLAVTVVLRPVPDVPSAASPFTLELFDPLRISSITTAAGRQVALERDISAPIVYVLSQSDREYISRFLRPGSTTANAGLFTIEPYQRGKIPIVFVHGLLSNRLTWANLANEIQAQPDLLARYQIWGFEYSTGAPFLQSAAALRRQLLHAKWQLDPTGSDVALSRMILVGHSMGGLISKLQVSHSGTQLWNSVACVPLDRIVTTPSTRQDLAEAFFFQPSTFISRVVFIGTPHRGSPWANRPIGRWSSSLVEEPPAMQQEHRQLVRDNPAVFSQEFARRIPTSIDLLEPDSPLLQAIDRLPHARRVQFHSIVGSGFWTLGAGESDRVVPVESARKSGVVSEKFVDARHWDLHKSPAGVAELLCVLRRHLQEFDRDFGS